MAVPVPPHDLPDMDSTADAVVMVMMMPPVARRGIGRRGNRERTDRQGRNRCEGQKCFLHWISPLLVIPSNMQTRT
jgi:hypothetical protein